jgi:protein-S-isoprenylcysteine O-methyltransferase Ste14
MATSSVSLAAPKLGFWRDGVFRLVMAACAQFVALTALAMLLYPGGTGADKAAPGYSFFTNFFSDLGRTVSHSGATNTSSMPLFVIALVLAGAGLMLFFIAFTQFFNRNWVTRVFSILGTIFGLVAGACFIGVALTPSNISGAAHGSFVLLAFGSFFLATVLYLVPMIVQHDYPTRYIASFAVFAAMLGVYLWLLFNGPRSSSQDGLLIQATGQKIIVYASVISIFIQAFHARRVHADRFERANG